MSKIMLISFALLPLLFFGNSSGSFAAESKQKISEAPTGTFQKMIVENGSVTMDLDLNWLNGTSSSISVKAGATPANSSHVQPPRLPLQLGFSAAANSFFTILVFNDLLRGPEPGSMALIPSAGVNPRATVCQCRCAHLLGSLWSRNFLRTRRLISLCAIAKLDSPSLTLKGISTILMHMRSCSASLAETCSFHKNLPTHSAGHQTLAQRSAKSPSAL